MTCPYCSSPIAIDEFQPWTIRANLLSAVCGVCRRTVTVAAETLRRQADQVRTAE